jgi:hypothetical protein
MSDPALRFDRYFSTYKVDKRLGKNNGYSIPYPRDGIMIFDKKAEDGYKIITTANIGKIITNIPVDNLEPLPVGTMIVGSNNGNIILPIGIENQVLTVDPDSDSMLKWQYTREVAGFVQHDGTGITNTLVKRDTDNSIRSTAIYFGDPTVTGTWRIIPNGNNLHIDVFDGDGWANVGSYVP